MLSGLILAGGRSARMGRDKAGLPLADGTTLLERQVKLLHAVGASPVRVSVKSDARLLVSGVVPVHDVMPDAGPLAGLAAGLRAATDGCVLTLAVDMGAVEESHLRPLLARSSSGCGVVPVVAGQLEGLAAVYPASLAASAEAALSAGERAVHAWVRAEAAAGRLRLWEAPVEWAAAFRSWNSPEDLPPK